MGLPCDTLRFFIFLRRNIMEHTGAREYILRRLREELPTNLYYHSYEHTLDVIRACEEIGQAEGINGEDMELLKTAAAYHDCGFLDQYNDNEELACQYARETLPGFEYTEEAIDLICHMIMATRNNIKPRTKLEEVICDADHDYLGRKDYKRIASSLYRELSEHGFCFQ